MLNNEYYLWGAGTYGARVIEFMRKDLVFKAVIDSDLNKQGKMFCGIPTISYEEAKVFLPKDKIVIAASIPRYVRKFLADAGYIQNQDFYTLFQFIPRYYWEKNKLAVQNINIVATTKCNMHCDGCQSYQHISKRNIHFDEEKVINDFNFFFKYIDFVINIPICCGESLLNAEAVAKTCSYVYKNFSGRYHTLSVVTNGSIIPDDELMRSFAESKTEFSISNYPKHTRSREMLIEKCTKFNVPYLSNTTCEVNNWHDLGNPHILAIDNPSQLKDGCWTVAQGLHDGWLYMCSAQMFAQEVAGIGEISPGDAFDLRKPVSKKTREELYKVISAQPEAGFISHCRRCNGVLTPLTVSR